MVLTLDKELEPGLGVCPPQLKSCKGVFLTPKTLSWVAVKELNLSYSVGETLLFTRYTHYGNLI